MHCDFFVHVFNFSCENYFMSLSYGIVSYILLKTGTNVQVIQNLIFVLQYFPWFPLLSSIILMCSRFWYSVTKSDYCCFNWGSSSNFSYGLERPLAVLVLDFPNICSALSVSLYLEGIWII